MFYRAYDKKFNILRHKAIAWAYQTIFHYIIIITLLNSLNVAMQYV